MAGLVRDRFAVAQEVASDVRVDMIGTELGDADRPAPRRASVRKKLPSAEAKSAGSNSAPRGDRSPGRARISSSITRFPGLIV
jgi:hypothetical protein